MTLALTAEDMTPGPECISEDTPPGPECISEDMPPGLERIPEGMPHGPECNPELVTEDTKPEFEPYHPASRTQNRELSGILGEIENDPDECVIVGETSVFPVPLPSTNEGLVKREMDVLSGNMPYLIKCY